MNKKRTLFWQIFSVIVAALIVAGGALLFCGRHYVWIALCLSVLACAAVFFTFERKNTASGEMTVLAVMVALSAMGRFVFAWLPGFKPVTAITVIAAVWLGSSSGFMVGSLSAFVSNFYFGQGPWTPFQMFAWGMVGFLAGLMSRTLKKNKVCLCVYGAFAGVLFSLLMDVWTVLWADGSFNFSRYAAAVLTALPVTAEYAVSNVLFLLALAKPFGQKLERIKKKYGLFIGA